MAQTPNATIKDLLSTGYFFDDLRKYPKTAEIDLPSYSRNFAIPYLTGMSESFVGSGQPDRGKILILAVSRLSDSDDDALTESIFELKQVAESEIDTNEKALHQSGELNKSELLHCRQKSESAQLLAKLLVSMIREFKLSKVNTKRDKSKGASNSLTGAQNNGGELSGLPSV
jgi:hypothetical protein